MVRERKFAEPVAPNRLPEAPPPKPEPMSAPLPCWSSTRPMIASATSTCSTMSHRFVSVHPVTSQLRAPRCTQIARKSSATSDAPPISPPSTSGIAKIAAAFCGFTLPPYRIARHRVDSRVRAETRAPPAPAPASRCGRCRSPRPARRRAPRLRTSTLRQHRVELARHHVLRRAGVALCQRLADAQDRRQARALRRGELRRHQRVGLAVELAPLRMPDDHVAAAELRQHRRRDFAGIGALRVLARRSARPTRSALPRSRSATCARYGNGAQTAHSAPVAGPDPASERVQQRAVRLPGCRASSSCRQPAGCVPCA